MCSMAGKFKVRIKGTARNKNFSKWFQKSQNYGFTVFPSNWNGTETGLKNKCDFASFSKKFPFFSAKSQRDPNSKYLLAILISFWISVKKWHWILMGWWWWPQHCSKREWWSSFSDVAKNAYVLVCLKPVEIVQHLPETNVSNWFGILLNTLAIFQNNMLTLSDRCEIVRVTIKTWPVYLEFLSYQLAQLSFTFQLPSSDSNCFASYFGNQSLRSLVDSLDSFDRGSRIIRGHFDSYNLDLSNLDLFPTMQPEIDRLKKDHDFILLLIRWW